MTSEMKNSDFHKFFVHELKDIYWAENALLKELPKMKSAATSEDLAEAISKHISETESHISKLEKVFASIDEKPEGKKCDGMAGILEEAKSVIEDTNNDSMTRDAALIMGAQKAEHYEIATYGTLRVFAKHMKHTEAEKLLTEILDNEKATNAALTGIAERFINEQAASE